MHGGLSVLVFLLAGLGAGPALAGSSSAAASRADDWPFENVSCPEAGGDPLLLVALGTSETAGWGIRADEPYSPQEAYPGRYADILCAEIGRPVELHSWYPSQLGNELAPLSWWDERVAGDQELRADLAAADVVVLWALGSHDVVPPLLFGACAGDWPGPLQTCLEGVTAAIGPEMDALFSSIEDLAPEGTLVLAADAYVPPALFSRWAAKPYWPDLKRLVDPHSTVEPLAEKHGFTFVPTEAAFNGPDPGQAPAEGLFQPDGLHPTAAGAQLTAAVFAEVDGLGD
jgi:hypothetical protein